MSYDIYLEATEPYASSVEIGNITYNIAPMWVVALGGAGIRRFEGAPGVEAAGPLSEGVERMRADPATYRAMNPPNGWGNYEGALEYLDRLARACALHPSHRIRIS